jgi:LysR family transcriptional regulator of abg operon
MQLNQVRAFIAVVDCGSLRAAARRLGVSQPAMTKTIRSLEADLNAQLVQRTTRGVIPTAAGKAFLARARVVQAELRKASEEVAQIAGQRGGSVAFGVSAPALAFVPAALAHFRQQHPAVQVRVAEGTGNALAPLVRDETLDFCVAQRQGAGMEGGLRYRPLMRSRLVVAGRRGHALARAKALSDLVDAPWLVFRAPGTGGLLERVLARAGLPQPKSIVHCESYGIALILLAAGDTLALIAPEWLELPFLRPWLQEIKLDDPIPGFVIGTYTRADAPLTPAASSMLKAVTAAASGLLRRG